MTRTGIPIFSTGGIKRRPLSELFEPSVYTPRSRYVRDPWWWEYPHLKPYTPLSSSYRPPAKSYLRDSYLSPVKRTYLWGHHPIRPFSKYTNTHVCDCNNVKNGSNFFTRLLYIYIKKRRGNKRCPNWQCEFPSMRFFFLRFHKRLQVFRYIAEKSTTIHQFFFPNLVFMKTIRWTDLF